MTALKAMTIWPAWQHFEEATKGSIEVGKLADFVILDKNPLEVDPETLDQIKVTETIKEGVTIFAMTEKGNQSNGAQHTPSLSQRSLVNLVNAMTNANSQILVPRTARQLGEQKNSPPCATCVCGGLSYLVEVMSQGTDTSGN